MKRQLVLILLMAAGVFSSCGTQKQKEETNTEKTADTSAVTKTTADPDPTDTIPADGYPAYNSDSKAAEMLRKTLTETILKNDLASIPADQHRFKYHAFDINNDKKDEYFVTITGSYFCGTGGCNFYIISHDGTVISDFSVSDFPVYVAASITDSWQDLIIQTGGKYHLIKMKQGKYPSNPSVEPLFTGDIPNMAPALLNIYDSPYPAFTF